MAAINATECLRRNTAYNVAFATATETTEVPVVESSERMVLLIKGGSTAKTITIKAGDAEVWGKLSDLTVTTGTTDGAVQAIVLDTARYKQTSGASKGNVIISGATGLGIAIIYTC